MRFQLTATNHFLFIHEGDLRHMYNEDGYVGLFSPMTVELQIVEGEHKGTYLLNGFEAEGFAARSYTEAMIEKIRAKGSVNFSKWWKLPEDTRSFEERYTENMETVERLEREAEGLYS